MSSYVSAEPKLQKSIKNLILIDSAAYKQEIPGFISLLRTPVVNSLALGLVPNNLNSETVLKELVYNDSLITEEMIQTYGSYLNGSDSHHALIQTANNIIPQNIDSLSAKYQEITIPVLIIWGEEDSIVHKSVGERLHREIAKSTFMAINDCGHIPQEEFPENTIDIINNFMMVNQEIVLN